MPVEIYPSAAKIKRNGVYQNLPAFVAETDDNAAQQMIATAESSNVAQYKHEVGEYFRLNDVLYETTNTINIGDNIVVGTNCKVAVLADNVSLLEKEHNELNDLFNTEASLFVTQPTLRSGAYNATNGAIVGNVARVCTAELISLEDYEGIYVPSGYEAACYHWDANMRNTNNISFTTGYIKFEPAYSATYVGVTIRDANDNTKNLIQLIPEIQKNTLLKKRSFSTDPNKIYNAFDYGFKPTNSQTNNTIALQNLLNGGNKTVIVTVPGTYYLNNTIYIDDNTEIIFCKGVILQKIVNYPFMFINRGAETRTYNSNITIRGLHIKGLTYESTLTNQSPLYGMRGHLSFLCVKNLVIDDFFADGLGTQQYALQANLCEQFILSHIKAVGKKDGLHISSSHDFVIRDCVFRTNDDCVGLNASDWASSNCVDGDIYNGVIENVIIEAETRATFRFLTGAWVNWYSGMSVRRSEIVSCNGNLYRVVANVVDTDYVSATEPTIDTYEGTQADEGGFSWKLMEKNVPSKYSANVYGIVIKNVVNKANVTAFRLQTMRTGTEYARTLGLDVAAANYPKIEIEFYNILLSGGSKMFSGYEEDYINIKVSVDNVRELKNEIGLLTASQSDVVKKWYNLKNIDFTKNAQSADITVQANAVVYINDCDYDESIAGTFAGRIITNCILASLPTQAKSGDIVKTTTGAYIYKNNSWVEL